MKELFQKYKTLIIIAVVVIVGFIVYTMFFTGGNNGTLLTSQRSTVSTSGGGDDLPVLLINLKSIKLDGVLFNDPAFQSLTDFGQELIPEPAGRTNPFAPVGTQ